MLGRYIKAQLTVLLFGGLVGPIFLIVYFALGPFARPYIGWMFWVGLLITAADVLAALWLTNAGVKSAARHEELNQRGVLVLAQITGISDTSWFVNDQQMIKVNLHFEVPGYQGFDTQETMASSPTRMQILNAHKLVALVEPGTQKYEIDWNASALIAGVVPAQFTLAEDNKTYDLRGQAGPLMEIMQILRANGVPMNGTIDIRSNPAVRQQVMAVVRRAAAGQPAAAAPAAPAAAPPAYVPPPMPEVSTAQRLQELETLRATGSITEAEYTAKRQQIISEL
ncbi:membrane protein implicated in regulation of membrane protease activity [Mycolicibacterium sp. BK556]|uniref:SHOCT domain-containing protein n=1 Tax=unclassified Mycolicibacterium TaxID=2636767 RepID=UPI00160FCF3E|nr:MULTISPECIES: SHOCT domain-containing protein [unclassified Mycolicibacterium]MBB3605433.1 membrane protein implicated in regulation of membrane protease activity [Mycolicibacterium sp. BK556]MBB3636070.1 membrane protein implicated in regulation of membrane protease activity [Mycolicibacterium sp. BK607]MBB3753482.1 membrane protein implicated in regulation of membrane protease activity [Mycolicibacterium sp. BK634]